MIPSKCEICNKQNPPRNKRFCSLACSIQKPTNYWKGKKFSEDYRKKLSEAHKGKMTGKAHPLWKGEQASYGSKHSWMRRAFGQPSECEHCYSTEAKRYEWANISGDYKRVREDWVRLCKPCHVKFDDITNRGWVTRRRNVDPLIR